MNITTQPIRTTNFKGFDKRVFEKFNSFSTEARKNIAEYSTALEKSKCIDLTLDKSDNLVLKIKEPLQIQTGHFFYKDDEISDIASGISIQNDTVVFCGPETSRGYINCLMDFGRPDVAKECVEHLESLINNSHGDPGVVLPAFGAYLDIANRIAPSVKLMQSTLSEISKLVKKY